LIKNKKISVVLLISLLFGVASCTSKMAYNNLDWIAAWYVDDYVTLTDTQEKEFDSAIKSFVSWHRKSELQNYILQIKYIKVDVKNGIKHSNVNNYTDSLRQFLDVALTKFEPEITKFAYSLSDKQVDQFLAEVEQRNIERIKKAANEGKQERLENKLERIESRVESFIGDLNTSQKQLLKETNQALLPTFDHWIEFRRNWANAIRNAYTLRSEVIAIEGLDSEHAKTVFREALKPTILETNSLRSEAHLAVLEHNQAIWATTIEKLVTSLSKRQLAALNDKLNETIEDLEALI